MRALPTLLALAALGGCAAPNAFQRATTLGQGQVELAVEPRAVVWPEEGGLKLGPDLSASVAYGFTDRLDLGLRGGGNGLEVYGRYQSYASDRLRVAVSPAIGRTFANLAFPVGFLHGPGELVVAPVLHAQPGTYAVGGSLGYGYQVSRGFRVLLEVRGLHAFGDPFEYGSSQWGFTRLQDQVSGGLAFQFLP